MDLISIYIIQRTCRGCYTERDHSAWLRDGCVVGKDITVGRRVYVMYIHMYNVYVYTYVHTYAHMYNVYVYCSKKEYDVLKDTFHQMSLGHR